MCTLAAYPSVACVKQQSAHRFRINVGRCTPLTLLTAGIDVNTAAQAWANYVDVNMASSSPVCTTACLPCVLACRSQGHPIKAACAALMVHDVSAAVTALHLGHEPEQAAMLCMVLGQAAELQEGLRDRVFEALAIKCEAAGGPYHCTIMISLPSRG